MFCVRSFNRPAQTMVEEDNLNLHQLGFLGGMTICFQATLHSISTQIDAIRANAGNSHRGTSAYNQISARGDSEDENMMLSGDNDKL